VTPIADAYLAALTEWADGPDGPDWDFVNLVDDADGETAVTPRP